MNSTQVQYTLVTSGTFAGIGAIVGLTLGVHAEVPIREIWKPILIVAAMGLAVGVVAGIGFSKPVDV